MSTQDHARNLMVRHHQLIKQRQQAMLGRVAAEIGMPAEEAANYWSHIQGKPTSASANYDRSHSSMS